MAEFNSKKGFVFVSKIKNLYFVPNDISREIDSMLICSGKNPNKYIKIVKKENTLNAGIVNPPRPSAKALWTGLPISSVQVGHEYKRD